MEIQELQTFNAPNIFSVREPIVKIQVKLGDLADVPTKDIGNINENIIELFPGIKDHKCSTGYVGGFVDRLKEGTYLPHVTEHLCLEVQRMLGYDIKHGKARQVRDDIYNIIYSCPEPVIGRACGTFVINTLNDLMDGKKVNIDNQLDDLRNLCVKYDQGVSTKAIIEEAKRRGIPVSLVEQGELVRLGYGKYQKCISATLYEGTSSIAVDIACNKQLTRALLDEAFIPVPKGHVCLNIEEAVQAANKIGYPVVVKPKSGNKGKYVYVGIGNEEELKAAFSQAVTFDGEVIVEKYVEGKDYRILVVGGNVVAAAERVPAHVIGNGVHTVEELVSIENRNGMRGEDHEKPLTKIKIDENMVRILKKQGLTIKDKPKPDQMVMLRDNGNLSTGGTAIDCTDIIHPANREIAERAAKTIGLDIAGIDMVIPDITKPMENGFGAIVEVNAAPGIRMHLNPAKGKKRDVVSPILDMIFPKDMPFTIPVAAITGTNGKTTTTRMISHVLRQSGKVVGTTTTHGIYVNDQCIEEGDTTGPLSAKRILNNRDVDVAVLETARGGIIRDGLAYEKADVAVFTNLSEDHLGVDGITTMEELLKVKSLVIEAVQENGACILNADDPWIMKVRDKAKGNVVLISLEGDNPLIKAHLEHGGEAVYRKGEAIYFSSEGFNQKVIDISAIPACLDGALKHNIYNSMAAIGACSQLGVPSDIIVRSMKTFYCDAKTNPGRFNVYDMRDFKVVLDYGHNIEGYRVTIDGLKGLNPERIIGIIGVPGDRKDEDIRKIGQLSGMSFDSLIIKEDHELRGRQPLEVANLLLSGALEGGIAKENAEVIPDEVEALKRAISTAKKGDIIAVFFEKMELLSQVLEEYGLPKNERHKESVKLVTI